MIPAVPARVSARKPEVAALEADTLAARLKRRRLGLGLRQKDAAKRMKVDEASIVHWEAGKEPMVRFYPAIIAFLGYEPWPEPKTVAEKLRAERRRRGWQMRHAAAFIGVDEGTFRRWEGGVRIPTGKLQKKAETFLH